MEVGPVQFLAGLMHERLVLRSKGRRGGILLVLIACTRRSIAVRQAQAKGLPECGLHRLAAIVPVLYQWYNQ